MTPERKNWVVFGAVSTCAALALGTLIYLQHQKIEERRAEADALRKQIADARDLIKTTPDLVREVIIQRETDATIKTILSDEEDVNNLVRTLHQFEEESTVTISSWKLQKEVRSTKKGKGKTDDFRRVGYTLTMDADTFQFLTFLDLLESHERFMSVTAFKLTAARKSKDSTEEPRHKIQLDLETYVYAPQGGASEVRIDQYERKRDLLVSEISKRTSELQLHNYNYLGARGRRDPWVDPRIPVDGEQYLSIEQQIAIVDELVAKAEEASATWDQVAEAENLIAEMKSRARLEELMAELDEGIRRVEAEGQLNYVQAARRFENQVAKVVQELRAKMENSDGLQPGPSLTALRECAESMERHIVAREYELALEAFKALEPRLPMAERDAVKAPMVSALRELEHLAKTVIEFESIDLVVGGIAVYEDRRPVALINGSAVSEGELIGEEVIVRNIRKDQIEFAYRGLVLARSVDGVTDTDSQADPSSKQPKQSKQSKKTPPRRDKK
jgi:hypothetical protein